MTAEITGKIVGISSGSGNPVYKVKTLKAASQQWWTSDNWEIRVVNANGTLSNLKEVNVVQFWVATFTGYGGSKMNGLF